MAAMQLARQDTSSTSLQIPPQPGTAFLRKQHPILPDTIQSVLAIINPKRGMEQPLQPQTAHPTGGCSSPHAGKSCWNLDLRVVILLVTLAGAIILLLLYKLLQMRHRLKLARARNALEYNSFYHRASYKLRQPTPSQDLPAKNGTIPKNIPLIQTVTAVTPAVATSVPSLAVPSLPVPSLPVPSLPVPSLPVPSLPVPSLPVPSLPVPYLPVPSLPVPPPLTLPLPPPPVLPSPPPHPPTSRVLSLPLPLPVIHTTPPSPHLSWGASSDIDVYSRIGAFRPSRLSSLSSQSTVILFEHSAL